MRHTEIVRIVLVHPFNTKAARLFTAGEACALYFSSYDVGGGLYKVDTSFCVSTPTATRFLANWL